MENDILLFGESEIMVKTLRKFSLEEIGSVAWKRQHEYFNKLNQQSQSGFKIYEYNCITRVYNLNLINTSLKSLRKTALKNCDQKSRPCNFTSELTKKLVKSAIE